MTSPTTVITITILTLLLSYISTVTSLGGSATTLSITYGSTVTICGIVSSQPSQRVQCWRNGQVFYVFSNISFEAISGGHDVFCGVRSGGSALVCWNPSLVPKRLYYNETFVLKELAVGDSQICAITNSTSGTNVLCWRDGGSESLHDNTRLGGVSSGLGFSCGVAINSNNGIICFGEDLELARFIESEFRSFRMLDIVVGGDHACGVNSTGFLICRGGNEYGQVNVPDHTSFEFSALALGVNHTCALRRVNSTVVCWGGLRGGMMSDYVVGVSFESIVAGLDFTCGLMIGFTKQNLQNFQELKIKDRNQAQAFHIFSSFLTSC